MGQTNEITGSCLCGAVQYTVNGTMRRVVYCHCSQCRKMHGHFMAATAIDFEHFKYTADSGLAWYQSSDIADRGFCKVCGSSLFYRPTHGKYIAIATGTLDAPTGLTSRLHIHVADASDYYEITDGLPQFSHDLDDPWED